MNAENVGEILDALAVRFGATGAHLWDMLIRQLYVTVATEAAMVVVLAVALFLVARFYWLGTTTEEFEAGDGLIPFVAIATGAGVVGLLVLLISLVVDAVQLLNPEYYALQKILEAFGQ